MSPTPSFPWNPSIERIGRVIQWGLGLGFWGRLSEGREAREGCRGGGLGRAVEGAAAEHRHSSSLSVAWLPRCARFAPLLLLFVSGPSSFLCFLLALLWAILFVSRTPSQQQQRYLERKEDISLGFARMGQNQSNEGRLEFNAQSYRRMDVARCDTPPRSTTVLLNGLDVVLMIERHMIWTITSID